MRVREPPVHPPSKAPFEKKKEISIICSKFPRCNEESWKTLKNISICIPSRAQKGGGRRLAKLFSEVAKNRERGQNLLENTT